MLQRCCANFYCCCWSSSSLFLPFHQGILIRIYDYNAILLRTKRNFKINKANYFDFVPADWHPNQSVITFRRGNVLAVISVFSDRGLYRLLGS
jgi:hypothetical protein